MRAGYGQGMSPALRQISLGHFASAALPLGLGFRPRP